MSRMLSKRARDIFPARRETTDWDDFFGSMFGRSLRWPFDDKELLAQTDWIPSVDIEETPERYLIKAEIPGMDKKDLDVSVDDGTLTIKGERRHETEAKEKKLHRTERSYGMFARSFTLPTDADDEHLNAEYRDGLLSVTIPKAREPKASKKNVTVK